jgi:hypothetical protein
MDKIDSGLVGLVPISVLKVGSCFDRRKAKLVKTVITRKKYLPGFGLGNRLAEGLGSCFKDQVEWCLRRPAEL